MRPHHSVGTCRGTHDHQQDDRRRDDQTGPRNRPAPHVSRVGGGPQRTLPAPLRAARRGDDSRRELHEHLLRHDTERFSVAERNGRIVGFSAGMDRGDWWFLSALFVHPEAQGAGVGRQLLTCAMAARPASDGVTVAISSARAARVEHAVRPWGLLPWLPLVTFVGTPRRVPRPALGSLEVTSAHVGDLAAVTQIDLVAIGVARSIDHRWYLGRGGRRGWLFLRAGRPAAMRTLFEGAIGPAAAVRATDMEPLCTWALAQAVAGDPSELSPDGPSSTGTYRAAPTRRQSSSPAPPASAIVPSPCLAAQRCSGGPDWYSVRIPASFSLRSRSAGSTATAAEAWADVRHAPPGAWAAPREKIPGALCRQSGCGASSPGAEPVHRVRSRSHPCGDVNTRTRPASGARRRPDDTALRAGTRRPVAGRLRHCRRNRHRCRRDMHGGCRGPSWQHT